MGTRTSPAPIPEAVSRALLELALLVNSSEPLEDLLEGGLFAARGRERLGFAAPSGLQLLGQGDSLAFGARTVAARRRQLLLERDDLGAQLVDLMGEHAAVDALLAQQLDLVVQPGDLLVAVPPPSGRGRSAPGSGSTTTCPIRWA